MDTKKLEIQAENYVSSQLSKFNFLVSKPYYDRDGCDLQILDNPLRPTRLIRVQSKGRSISSDAHVEIPLEYVNDDFVLFVYLIDENYREELYVFFPGQIKTFISNDKKYNIYFYKKNFTEKFSANLFTSEHAENLKDLLSKTKIKEETTVIIDCFCLENSIKSTIDIYKEIYPEKEISFPDFLQTVKHIIECYDKKKAEGRIINVYLFITPHNFLETSFFDEEELFVEKSKIRIFEMRIDGLISFEIEDFLNRVINSENSILVASDKKYVPLLNDLRNEKKDIALVCEKKDNGLRDYGFKWGDISYPIGLAMGLERHEL